MTNINLNSENSILKEDTLFVSIDKGKVTCQMLTEDNDIEIDQCFAHKYDKPDKAPIRYDKVMCGCSYSPCSCSSDDCEATVVALVPSIALVKSSPEGPYKAGDTITYTFVVTNDGETDLTGVMVVDDIATVVGGPIDLAIGAVDTDTFTATYVVTDADVTEEQVVNVASVSGTYTDEDGVEVVVDATDTNTAIVEALECDEGPLTAACSTASQDQIVSVLTPLPEDLVTSELDRFQYGDGIFGSQDTGLADALVNTNELHLDIPEHSRDCKLWLHLTGGQIARSGIPTSVSASSDASVVPVLVSEMDLEAGSSGGDNADIWSNVYCMDGTGDGTGSIIVELGDLNLTDIGDHVMGVWSETCSPTRALGVLDIDIANAIEYTGIPASDEPLTINQADTFTVECPALIFGAGRHVAHPDTGTAEQLVDASWFNPSDSAGEEVYDIVGHDGWECQSGLGMDFMANAGTYSWDWMHNATTGYDADWDGQAMATVLPFSCDGTWQSPVQIIEGCEASVINTLCSGIDSSAQASFTCSSGAIVNVNLTDGATLNVYPIIDGVVQVNNPTVLVGPLTGDQVIPVADVTGSVSYEGTASCQVGLELQILGGAEGSDATVISIDSEIVVTD